MNIDTSWTLLRGGGVLFDKRRGSRADVGLRVSEKENFLKFENWTKVVERIVGFLYFLM